VAPTPAASAEPTDAARATVTPTAAGTQSTPVGSPSTTPTATPDASIFRRLQDEIFTPRCATQFCHSRQTMAGALVLAGDGAFASLVGVEPANAAARSAGMLRVDPFVPENSFLLIKLGGPPSSAFGARMPLIGAPLTEEQMTLIRGWIGSGAIGGSSAGEAP
jgi:hypothetical protein